MTRLTREVQCFDREGCLQWVIPVPSLRMARFIAVLWSGPRGSTKIQKINRTVDDDTLRWVNFRREGSLYRKVAFPNNSIPGIFCYLWEVRGRVKGRAYLAERVYHPLDLWFYQRKNKILPTYQPLLSDLSGLGHTAAEKKVLKRLLKREASLPLPF